MVDWLDAINEERRLRGDLAALESGLETMTEVGAYRAWRKLFDRALTHEQEDRGSERARHELARRVEAMRKSMAQERERLVYPGRSEEGGKI
jgi:hypothetical protein